MKTLLLSARRYLAVMVAVVLGLGGAAILGVGPASATGNGAQNFGIASPSTAPTILTGTNNQSASNVTFNVVNDWGSGANTVTLTLSPNGATSNNCTTGNDVLFAATPTATAGKGSGNEAAPTVTVAPSTNAADTGCGTSTDVLTLTFTPSPATGTATDTFPVTISGIAYNVGSAAGVGPVTLDYLTSIPTAVTTQTAAVSNATVATKANAGATGNSPQTYITVGASGAVSNLVVTEAAKGQVGAELCITPIAGETTFAFSGAPPTVTVTPSGTGITSATATIVAGAIQVAVAGSPSASPATFTLSGVSVTDGSTSGPAQATVTTGATCPGTTVIQSSVPVFNSAPTLNTAIAGIDTDATAINELETTYPVSGGCLPTSAKNSVILATDQNFPDALAASYLAGYLHTGILLTPTANLSSETQAALQAEGITNVYVMGGPLAISQNTISQIEATPAYTCGGPATGTKTGGNIQVTGPIYGQTQYDTAEQIAATPPISYVASLDLAGAYAGQYNDTTGNQSSTPSAVGAISTAIIASGANFPDASAASVMAYHSHIPLLLTDPNSLSPQASSGLSALGIKQVIVLGGPLAVSNADVTSIQGMGISVIRIAGQDPTDTAQMLASFELNQQGTTFSGLGWGATWGGTVMVARGDFYSDALAGSVLDAVNSQPLVLTADPATVGQYLAAFLGAGGSSAGIDNLNNVAGSSGNIKAIQPLGGPLALNATTQSTMVSDVANG